MVQLTSSLSSESPAARIERELAEGAVILLDGARGTALRGVEEGARLVGACCGFGVARIDALANALARSDP